MHEKCYTHVSRRKRMAEGLYIENGTWIAIYRDRDGRQRSKTLPFVRNLTEAKKARRTLLADLEAKEGAGDRSGRRGEVSRCPALRGGWRVREAAGGVDCH